MGDEIPGDEPVVEAGEDIDTANLKNLIDLAMPLIVGRAAMLKRVFWPELAALRVYLKLVESQQDEGVGPTDH